MGKHCPTGFYLAFEVKAVTLFEMLIAKFCLFLQTKKAWVFSK